MSQETPNRCCSRGFRRTSTASPTGLVLTAASPQALSITSCKVARSNSIQHSDQVSESAEEWERSDRDILPNFSRRATRRTPAASWHRYQRLRQRSSWPGSQGQQRTALDRKRLHSQKKSSLTSWRERQFVAVLAVLAHVVCRRCMGLREVCQIHAKKLSFQKPACSPCFYEHAQPKATTSLCVGHCVTWPVPQSPHCTVRAQREQPTSIQTPANRTHHPIKGDFAVQLEHALHLRLALQGYRLAVSDQSHRGRLTLGQSGYSTDCTQLGKPPSFSPPTGCRPRARQTPQFRRAR